MEVKGLFLSMLDIPAEYTKEYNRWYDQDHLPEHMSKDDVITARRYVAPRDLQSLSEAERSERTGGHPPYATLYFLGGDDFLGSEALAAWTAKDRTMLKAGRFWRSGRAAFSGRWRLDEVVKAASLLVSDAAVPYVAHRGIVVALGRVASVEARQEATNWWLNIHLVDLFAAGPILAALRCTPCDPAHSDLLLHILLCDADPADIMLGITNARRYQRAVGRFPAHGGAYESIAFLPFRSILPFHYDFDVPSDGWS